jgi:hypothetical protein
VDRTAAVVVEEDLPAEVLVEDRARCFAVDPAVVEALRQADEVPCETVAADVRRLPGPLRLQLVTQRLVEGAAIPCAAGIVLAVRADEEERMVDFGAGSQVDAAEVFVALELGAGDLDLAGSRGGGEGEEPRSASPVRPPDEEQAAVRHGRDLLAQVLLDLVGEPAAGERVARPQAAVLDEKPVVDPAGGRGERLGVLAREVRAEGPRLGQPSSCMTRQIT